MDWHDVIMGLRNTNLQFAEMKIGNESLITRARNKIISYFYVNKQYTNLLFLDADIKISPDDIIKLINQEKDAIGAGVALKGFNQDGSPVLNFTPIERDRENRLVKVAKAGNAVLLLSRKAVDILIENSEPYRQDTSRGVQTNWIQYDVFKVGVYDREYLSEDYYISKILRENGIDVYVDTTIRTIHNGNFPFYNM